MGYKAFLALSTESACLYPSSFGLLCMVLFLLGSLLLLVILTVLFSRETRLLTPNHLSNTAVPLAAWIA